MCELYIADVNNINSYLFRKPAAVSNPPSVSIGTNLYILQFKVPTFGFVRIVTYIIQLL